MPADIHKGVVTQTRPCNILQYFTAEKNFQMKKCNIFLIFAFLAQIIDRGYTLEPPASLSKAMVKQGPVVIMRFSEAM